MTWSKRGKAQHGEHVEPNKQMIDMLEMISGLDSHNNN